MIGRHGGLLYHFVVCPPLPLKRKKIKMKFALASDLHLEFDTLELNNTEGADVLVLSGDICVAKDLAFTESMRSEKWMKFFTHCSEQFKDVIYIMGNHEHYNGDFAKSYDELRGALSELPNIHVMEKEFITLGDVTFICGTLWTDMNKEDPHTLYSIKGYMNDYRVIENSDVMIHFKAPVYGTKEDGSTDYHNVVRQEYHKRPAKFTPELSVIEHKAMLKLIDEVTKHMATEKIVVVGHHAPSKLSTKPQYQDDVMVNGAYSSDLSEFILDRPMIKVWTHGHTHDTFDYLLGSTRIVCNPRGYHGYEDRADNFQLQYIEV
jgi:Icc-related predicted phosphoesterase